MAKLPTAPWQNGRSKKPKMLLCHFTNGELQGLDNLQGGSSIDPKTGVREYSKLARIIENPEIQDIFKAVAVDLKDGRLSKPLSQIYKEAKKTSQPFYETPEELDNRSVQKLEALGEGDDTKLAWIPYNLAEFLIELKHGPSINKSTGLLQFDFFDEFLRVTGTIGGAIIGGPIGAGIGRGLAGKITGQKTGDALRSGLDIGSKAALVSGIGGALANVAPGMAGSLGAGATNMLGAPAANAMGGFFTGPMSTMGIAKSFMPAAAGTAAAGAAGGTGAAAGAGTAAGAAGAAPAAGAAAWGGLGSLLSNPALLMGGMGLMSYLGSKKQHDQEKKAYAERNKSISNTGKSMGFDRDWAPVQPPKRIYNPEFSKQTASEAKHGVYRGNPYLPVAPAFAKGGSVKSHDKGVLIKGPGKGQDDLIQTKVPEGSYIIDASSTGMFGDGSSEAGGKILKQFEKRIQRSVPKGTHRHVAKKVLQTSATIPVYLSNDEYKFDPTTVAILGKGSNERGSKMLKSMVKSLRDHKNSNGDRLPPKAKSPEAYIKWR